MLKIAAFSSICLICFICNAAPATVKECNEISDEANKLACYEEATGMMCNKATESRLSCYEKYAQAHERTEPKADLGSWRVTSDTDVMTNEKSAFAFSIIAKPIERMDFPYSDAVSWLGFGCDGLDEWAFVGFSVQPNLSNDETEDGYNFIETRIKFDDTVGTTSLTQEWGAKFLHFVNDREVIAGFAKGSMLILELDWHGEGKVHFEWPLNGSANAIVEARDECNN